MTDGFRPDGIDAVPVKAAEAAAALEALREPAERAAASIDGSCSSAVPACVSLVEPQMKKASQLWP